MVAWNFRLLSLSWVLQAMLTYNREAKEVQLAVDRSYTKGEPIEAWCGPQVRIFDMLQ